MKQLFIPLIVLFALSITFTGVYAQSTPPPLEPSVTVERQADGSIVLAWENIRTSGNYNIRITESGTDKTLRSVPSDTSEYTFSPDDFGNDFNRVGNAERIGVDGVVNGRVTDLVWSSIPPLISVTLLSFEYNDNGSTEVTFTPSAAGSYTISYIIAAGETAVDSVTVSASQANSPVTDTLLTLPGYAGVVTVSFGSAEYNRGTIAVPPAPPTLSLGEVTATSIQLTWDESRGATSYELFRSNDSVETTSELTFTDTGLTPQTLYTYTITSTGATGTSALSNTVIATTTPPEPSVTVERLADNSIKLTWENINTDTGFYDIYTSTSGTDSLIIKVPSSIAEYIFRASSGANFNLVNNAERVGVFGTVGGTGTDQRSEPVPPLLPIVTAERLADDSIKLTWDGIHTADPFNVGFFYQVWLTEGGVDDALNIFTEFSGDTTLTIPPDDGDFDRINRAQKIGIAGNNPFGSDLTLVPVPPIPSVTAERLAGDAIKLTWENIRTDNGFYRIHIDNTASFTVPSTTSEFTLDPTHRFIDRANRADTVGISGSIGGEVVDQRFVPVPASILPTVNAERLADNSILITWSNIPTDTSYGLKILEDGAADTLHVDILVEHFTIPTTHRHFDRINNADSIGINGIAGTSSTPTHYIPVPAQRLPTVTAERLDNNSLKLDWENIRTTDNIYQIRVSDSTGNSLAFTIDVTGNSHTFSPSDTNFDQVNNADKIIIGGLINEQLVDHRSVKVPAQIPPLTIERLVDNSLKVSWKNIPSDTGRYDIWISGNGFDQRVQRTNENPFIFTSNHADFDKINRANTIGIVASNGHLADRVYGDIPPLLPLGIPTLSSGDITDTTIELLWTKAVDAISYELFRDDTSIENTTARTFTDTGLTPEIEYTYHVRSVGDSDIVSDSSNVLTVTTLATLEITFERLAGGDIEVTWKGIGSTGGANSIWIIENDVKTEIISSTTSPHTFTTLDDLYERVSNAEEIGVSDLNASSDDVEFIKIKSKDGNSDEWKTKPTFGSSWDTQTQLVDAGFVFNGIPLTITDNWHTDFDLTSSIIGENNIIHIKGYASNDFKSVTLSLGIPEIGKKYDAESHITLNLNRNYTAPSDYQIMEIIHDQKEGLVNESMTSATLSKAKCTPADVVKQCIDFEISFVMMAPLKHEVLAISAMDSQYRETVTFINQGVEFVGESLLESQTHVLTQKYSNQHQAETIELTQLDRRYQMWEDQNGYLWTQNEYNSWLQITIPDVTQRDDPATSVMTRNHSNFAGMITQEQDRATLVFNSLEIQGIPDEPFAHDTPLRLEKLSNPEVLEILHIQALLAEELLCDCILLED